ncbi:hypothetical protein [Xanthomonas translucens]|uniref:hypothetical protein n=1 Tax=Xanthomonas campestris pv. translucens TaxID=343 RepID=UPI001F4F06BE|nr:hypothetical protein [Xanthomonas translucens]
MPVRTPTSQQRRQVIGGVRSNPLHWHAMSDSRRKIVLVSGAPGAGNTTLAVPLATRLGFPLFCKDFIKETLTDALGDSGGDLAASRRIGGAAMEPLWWLARHAPHSGAGSQLPASQRVRTRQTGRPERPHRRGSLPLRRRRNRQTLSGSRGGRRPSSDRRSTHNPP